MDLLEQSVGDVCWAWLRCGGALRGVISSPVRCVGAVLVAGQDRSTSLGSEIKKSISH